MTTDIPADLFIPPDALEVLLDSFTGPLDLLLYLIRKQNIDILNIPMVLITEQYLQYIQILETRLELAGDYLVMAAVLIEIKSRILLPKAPDAEDLEDDPRSDLVKKLFLYEQFKELAVQLDNLPQLERDNFLMHVEIPELEAKIVYPELSLDVLINSMKDLLKREHHLSSHFIKRELLSVQEKIGQILLQLQTNGSQTFAQLLSSEQQRAGVVVTFLSVLELARQYLVTLSQPQILGPIFVQVKEHG